MDRKKSLTCTISIFIILTAFCLNVKNITQYKEHKSFVNIISTGHLLAENSPKGGAPAPASASASQDRQPISPIPPQTERQQSSPRTAIIERTKSVDPEKSLDRNKPTDQMKPSDKQTSTEKTKPIDPQKPSDRQPSTERQK